VTPYVKIERLGEKTLKKVISQLNQMVTRTIDGFSGARGLFCLSPVARSVRYTKSCVGSLWGIRIREGATRLGAIGVRFLDDRGTHRCEQVIGERVDYWQRGHNPVEVIEVLGRQVEETQHESFDTIVPGYDRS
jgi:hypothetical protein